MDTNQELNNEQLDYIDSFEKPAEFDFLSEKQKQELESEQKKLEKSILHFKAKFGVTSWSNQMDKEMISGRVYTIPQALTVKEKFDALNWYGTRQQISKSLITPTGQRVIMSQYCSENLGLVMDSYITLDSLPTLLKILKTEGVDYSLMEQLKVSAKKFGVIILQNGTFSILNTLISDFTRRMTASTEEPQILRSIPTSSPAPEVTAFEKRLAEINSQHGADLDVLKSKLEQTAGPTKTDQVIKEVKKEIKPIAPKTSPMAAEIKREINTRELPVHHEPKIEEPKPVIKPAPVVQPPPPPAPVRKEIEVPKPNPKAFLMPNLSLKDMRKIDDLKKIEIGHIRLGPLKDQIIAIRSKIMDIARSNHVMPYYAVSAFEQSPLIKIYLASGNAKVAGLGAENDLTHEEFEAIADLKRQIEQF